MRLLFWIAVAVFGAILASFAASNRETAAFTLWPLPFVLQLPLYLAVVAAVALGFALSAFAAWIGGARRRREARRRARRLAALERELAATQAQLPASEASTRAPLPARL